MEWKLAAALAGLALDTISPGVLAVLAYHR